MSNANTLTAVTKTVFKITRAKGNATSTITTRDENIAQKWLEVQAKEAIAPRSGVVITVKEIVTTERVLSPNVSPNVRSNG
jgi:hypothetical protein